MKKLFLGLVAFSAIWMSSCKNPGSSDPKTVLISFFDAMSKKDMDAARKLATTESKSMLDMIEMGMKMGADKDSKEMEKFDKSKMEMSDAKIDGDRATVNVKEKTSGEAVDFVLKKQDGSWKVAMDMETLMNIGMQKMKDKGMGQGEIDSLRNGLDKLKNMNPDSLKDIMNKGMNTLDSLKKAMKNN
jgi:hypothetical protein